MEETFSCNGIEYEVRRNPRRKYPEVIINHQGKIWIALPLHCTITDELAKEFAVLIDKIIERTKNFPKINLPEPKKYCEGEKFYYRGTEYPLHLREGIELEFDGKAFWLGRDDIEYAPTLFENWYKQALYKILTDEMHDFFVRTNTSPAKISIRTVKTWWGSCSKSGNIKFCTKLALVPYELFEYVVIHELCHLKEFDHSKKFWQEVEKYLPDYKERLATLKKDGDIYTWQ